MESLPCIAGCLTGCAGIASNLSCCDSVSLCLVNNCGFDITFTCQFANSTTPSGGKSATGNIPPTASPIVSASHSSGTGDGGNSGTTSPPFSPSQIDTSVTPNPTSTDNSTEQGAGGPIPPALPAAANNLASKRLKSGPIAGISIGAIVLATILAICLFLFLRRSKKTKTTRTEKTIQQAPRPNPQPHQGTGANSNTANSTIQVYGSNLTATGPKPIERAGDENA